jgi:hypothetical protein
VGIRDALASAISRDFKVVDASPCHGLIQVKAVRPSCLGFERLFVYLRQTDSKVLFTTLEEIEKP